MTIRSSTLCFLLAVFSFSCSPEHRKLDKEVSSDVKTHLPSSLDQNTATQEGSDKCYEGKSGWRQTFWSIPYAFAQIGVVVLAILKMIIYCIGALVLLVFGLVCGMMFMFETAGVSFSYAGTIFIHAIDWFYLINEVNDWYFGNCT